MEGPVLWPVVIFIATVVGAAVVLAWNIRGALSDLKDDLKRAISDGQSTLRTEFNSRITPIETDVQKLELQHAEHRTEDAGWFRNLGERIARLENTH